MRGHGRVDRGPASGPDDHWSVAPIIRRRGHRGASGCCLGSFCCRPSLGSGRCRVIGDVRACWCAAVPDPVANVEPDQVSSIRPRRRSTHTADRWRLRRGSHERNAVPRSGGSREPVRCRGDAGVAHHPADSRNRRPGAAAHCEPNRSTPADRRLPPGMGGFACWPADRLRDRRTSRRDRYQRGD